MNGAAFDAVIIGTGQAGPPLAGRLTAPDPGRGAVPIHPTVSELIPTVLGEMKPAPTGG